MIPRQLLRLNRSAMTAFLLFTTVLVSLLLLIISEPQQHCDNDICLGGNVESVRGAPHEVYGSGVKAEVHLSVVACGDRLEETLVMIKSALLFTHTTVMVHIFAEDDLRPQFKTQLDSWPLVIRERLLYKLYPIQFPRTAGYSEEDWKKLFKLCASQRLFLPSILKDVDALIYVDTDILFMRPIEDLWHHFSSFNSSQLAALSPEHENPSAGWYNRFARHPYYGPLGVNSGVMLMNLTRMRECDWITKIVAYHKEYRYKITWGDQDLINIFFHYYPEKLYIYDCSWNYRPDHCMYMSNCKPAEEHGVSVVHGSRSTFHNEKQPLFKAIYQAFEQTSLDPQDNSRPLLTSIGVKLQHTNVTSTNCGRVAPIFTKKLAQVLNTNH